MNEICHEIWLGCLRIRHKKEYVKLFGSVKALYEAGEKTLLSMGIPYNEYLEIADKGKRSEAVKILDICIREGISPVGTDDEGYPAMLKHISDPPRIIYIKGKVDSRRKCVAVVGSRKPSPYGIKCTAYFVSHLSRKGFVIVSGMAYGIDTKAHTAALENGGVTYAVLGGGICEIYPAQNRGLSEKIAGSGALISEYMPFRKPEKHFFPVRNRIISGICHASLIVEGREGSGSLITATHSIEQGREVFCIPGNIFSENSRGVNALINEGARLVSDPDEITDYLDGLCY